METLMTVSEAARALGKASETIRLWERNGKLPAIKTAGGVRLFRSQDVMKLAKKQELESRASSNSQSASV